MLGYQKPCEEILELADAPVSPLTKINSKGNQLVLLERSRYIGIEALSEKEMRLGGLRINPKTNISSRQTYYSGAKLMKVGEKESTAINGLPKNARLAYFNWSPDESMMAFTNTVSNGVELWILDIKESIARRVVEAELNANLGKPFIWSRGGQSLIVKLLPKNRAALIDKTEAVPTGPTISTNDGEKAQNRTYQDLLKDKVDEANFENLATSELYKVDLEGNKTLWQTEGMHKGMSISPDGEYMLLSTMHHPFSYLVPYSRFPFSVTVYDKNGQEVKRLLEVPLIENLPQGFMAVREGMRNVSWRKDKAATLYWAEALDGGDPETEVEYRDQVLEQEAPFDGETRLLLKTKNRYYTIEWGNDELAIAHDYWWNTRNMGSYVFNPSNNKKAPVELYNRNYQDKYSDPGQFVDKKNEYGQYVLEIIDGKLYLLGEGYSPDGIRPFVDELDIRMLETKRLWQADGEQYLERLYSAIDMKKGIILCSKQAKNVFPNYYLRHIYSKGRVEQITFNPNPFTSIQNLHKAVIRYKREDGLELSATMYLPVGYNKNSGEKLPMVMWAYPKEFKNHATAGQVTASDLEFTYPWYGSPIFWAARGYIVLDDAAFPIVGEGKEEPNDSFITQLVANAKAAIDAVDDLGYLDRKRVAVGGHSYGAFMTANLLTHSDLFAAGIARSGAYNRTLTPFGFQAEERYYWDAPDVYNQMSPFMNAHKMKKPLLIVHGAEDNNSGTYPMQSERYFNALKGLGATVRLVMLPMESHSYQAKESVLHLLWEQDQWLEKYVKQLESTDD
ncbi:MAG: S9 family peptidase [Aureispira sp.]|nr:S9 family peptidase [Aureispira sp.]